jgi:hypothetical protein
MENPFVGTWILNLDKSQFDVNHRPAGGSMRFELETDGSLLMTAEGIGENGAKIAERPQKFVPDGIVRPLEGLSGLSSVCRSRNASSLEAEARRDDGTVVGKGVYAVSRDGETLTATTSGFDSQMRRFEIQTVWDRA